MARLITSTKALIIYYIIFSTVIFQQTVFKWRFKAFGTFTVIANIWGNTSRSTLTIY